MLKNGRKILYTNEEENPSPYLVNLNKYVLSPEEEYPKKRSFYERLKSFFFTFSKKDDPEFFYPEKKEFDKPDNLFRRLAAKIGLRVSGISERSRESLPHFSDNFFSGYGFFKKSILGGNKLDEKEHYIKIKRLSFFGPIKIVFVLVALLASLVLRLGFGIGWLVAFSARFFVSLNLFLIKKSAKFFVDLFDFDILPPQDKKHISKPLFFEEKKHQKIPQIHHSPEIPKAIKEGSLIREIFNIEHDHRLLKNGEFVSRLLKAKNIYVNKRPFTFRSFFAFVLVLLILVSPFGAIDYYQNINILKGRVLGASESAVHDMMIAAGSMADFNFLNANQGFVQASNSFFEAQKEIEAIGGLLKILNTLPNDKLKLVSQAEIFLKAGEICADIGGEFSAAFSIFDRKEEINTKNIINSFYEHGNNLSVKINELHDVFIKIDPRAIPEEYRETFISFKEKLLLIDGGLDEFIDILEKARIFLGFDIDKRYLFVFQNNTEMRASGGFMGSFAVVDFSNGEISELKVPGGGTYDTEAGLRYKVVAPKPLHLVNPLWHLWDANWWPDWPKTAQKLQWFYEKSDGSTVDGVVSFTPTVMENFLRIIGPIDMTEEYGEIFTTDNFWDITQRLAEQKQHITLEPKKIIGDLFEKIIQELPQRLDRKNFISLFRMASDMGEQKHILFYFNDDLLQKKSIEMGFDGRVKDPIKDYLMVVNTNIAGQKTDKKIQEEIYHKAEVSNDGSIVNTLTISRTHTGIKGEEFTGVRNVDWMRIYVPEGSELISAGGFEAPPQKYFEYPDPDWIKDEDVLKNEENAVYEKESGTMIYNELGKTVFANWSQVDPGETVTLELKYRLPFKIKFDDNDNIIDRIAKIINREQKEIAPYSLLAQKQPGSMGSRITSELILPDNYQAIWHYPVTGFIKGWNFSDLLDTDKYFAVIIEKN